MAFDLTPAAFGVIGIAVGGYIQFALQDARHKREERSALARLDALLGDIQAYAEYSMQDGYFEDSAWKPRVERLMRHTELTALATAFRKQPNRYSYVLRVAAAIERQAAALSSKGLAPPTQDDIDRWAASLRRKHDRRVLVQAAFEDHGDVVRAWVEPLLTPIRNAREDVRNELAGKRSWLFDFTPNDREITEAGILIAREEDLRDPHRAADQG